MPRSFEICGSLSLVLALAHGCGRTGPPPASSPPATATAAEPAPDPNGPPLYKPSGKSAAPMSIADPAYGAFDGAPKAPTLGDTLPDFEVPLADGGTFSLAEARRAGPVLLFFYRGFW